MVTLVVITVLCCSFAIALGSEEVPSNNILGGKIPISIPTPDKNCTIQRRKALLVPEDYDIIPDCHENGTYVALQCFRIYPLCVCVREDGTIIGDHLDHKVACKCVREKDHHRRINVPGILPPRCEKNGTYSPVQCDKQLSCRCVNPNGDPLDEPFPECYKKPFPRYR